MFLQRDKDNTINVVELAKPVENATNAPGGILLLLRSVTNAVAMLLNSTNQWSATVHDVDFTNCALASRRPCEFAPGQAGFGRHHAHGQKYFQPARARISPPNCPCAGTPMAPSTRKSPRPFLPPTADIHLSLVQSRSRHARSVSRTQTEPVHPRQPAWTRRRHPSAHAGKRAAAGYFSRRRAARRFPHRGRRHGQDLLKWDSLRFNGIDANLNPQSVAIKEIAAGQRLRARRHRNQSHHQSANGVAPG